MSQLSMSSTVDTVSDTVITARKLTVASTPAFLHASAIVRERLRFATIDRSLQVVSSMEQEEVMAIYVPVLQAKPSMRVKLTLK